MMHMFTGLKCKRGHKVLYSNNITKYMFELQLLNAKSANDIVGIHADENLVDLMQAAGVSVPLCVRI